jgi:hypothetical protein
MPFSGSPSGHRICVLFEANLTIRISTFDTIATATEDPMPSRKWHLAFVA